MQIMMITKTPRDTVKALSTEFNRQLSLTKQDSLRVTTARKSQYWAGRISQLKTVIEFLDSITFED